MINLQNGILKNTKMDMQSGQEQKKTKIISIQLGQRQMETVV